MYFTSFSLKRNRFLLIKAVTSSFLPNSALLFVFFLNPDSGLFKSFLKFIWLLPGFNPVFMPLTIPSFRQREAKINDHFSTKSPLQRIPQYVCAAGAMRRSLFGFLSDGCFLLFRRRFTSVRRRRFFHLRFRLRSSPLSSRLFSSRFSYRLTGCPQTARRGYPAIVQSDAPVRFPSPPA